MKLVIDKELRSEPVWQSKISRFFRRRRAQEQTNYKVVGRSFFDEYFALSDEQKKDLLREMLRGLSPTSATKTNESDSEQRDHPGDTRL